MFLSNDILQTLFARIAKRMLHCPHAAHIHCNSLWLRAYYRMLGTVSACLDSVARQGCKAERAPALPTRGARAEASPKLPPYTMRHTRKHIFFSTARRRCVLAVAPRLTLLATRPCPIQTGQAPVAMQHPHVRAGHRCRPTAPDCAGGLVAERTSHLEMQRAA